MNGRGIIGTVIITLIVTRTGEIKEEIFETFQIAGDYEIGGKFEGQTLFTYKSGHDGQVNSFLTILDNFIVFLILNPRVLFDSDESTSGSGAKIGRFPSSLLFGFVGFLKLTIILFVYKFDLRCLVSNFGHHLFFIIIPIRDRAEGLVVFYRIDPIQIIVNGIVRLMR